MSERDQSGDTPDIVERLEEAAESSQWHVFFSNYYPQEVDSVWDTEEGARARASSLDGDWNVEPIGDNPNAELLREAAQTIKDLRAEVATLTLDRKSGWYETVNREHAHQQDVEIPDLVEQIDSLRSRLQEAEKVVKAARAAAPDTELFTAGDSKPAIAYRSHQVHGTYRANLRAALAAYDSTLGGKTEPFDEDAHGKHEPGKVVKTEPRPSRADE